MAFDKTLPADSSKIRESAGFIRNNWDAMQDGDYGAASMSTAYKPRVINLPDQTASGNPTVSSGVGRLFAKVSDSVNELFYLDDAGSGVLTQLTDASKKTLGTAGSIYIAGGLLLVWDVINAIDGATVTFPTAFSAAPYIVVGTEKETGTNTEWVKFHTYTTTNCLLSLRTTANTPATNARNIAYLAIGAA